MTAIPLLSGPQDPSQLEATINSLIVSLNGVLSQSSPNVENLVTGTTAVNLPSFGTVILSSTVAGAAYKLAAPVTGQSVRLITKNTKSQTVTLVSGNFADTRTKLTFKTTNVGVPQAIYLLGLSTAVWAVKSAAGAVKCT